MSKSQETLAKETVSELLIATNLQRLTARWQRICLFSIGFMAIGYLFTPTSHKVGVEHIAVVQVSGVLQSKEESWYRGLEQVMEDSNARALVLKVNSPGGVVHVADSAHSLLKRIHARMPIVTVVDQQAASAAYLLACSSDLVLAKMTSVVGSVGVVTSVVVVKELMEKFGVDYLPSERTQTITDIPFLGLTPFIKKYLYMAGEDSYQWFRAIVQQGRGLSDKQLSEVVDGRIFLGYDALAKGLIDGYGTVDTAITWLAANKGMQLASLPLVDYDV